MTLTSCDKTVLDERFFDNRLSNWTVIDDPDCVEGPSEWRVKDDGRLYQLSNIWGKRGHHLGLWYGTYLVRGDAEWKDYTLWVMTRASDDDGFGVVFRYIDPEHYYRLIFINDKLNGGPLVRLDKREQADFTEIWSEPRGYPENKDIFLSIHVSGEKIQVNVDDILLCEARDYSYRNGRIGLFCFAQRNQAFDDVRVALD